MTNKNLRKLLIIENFKHETVFDIVGRMKVLLDYFQHSRPHHNLSPFLWIYYLVTKTVAEKSVTKRNYFYNPRALEILDVHFASLYFVPLLQFLESGKTPKPWKAYFQYCRIDRGTPFVQMLLGINSHINGDLLTAVKTTKYNESKDFQKINRILDEEIPAMMRHLALQHQDVYGLGGMIFKRFAEQEFKKTIVKWRNIVWQNSLAPKISKNGYFNQTEDIAKTITTIFEDAKHFKHLPSLIGKFNDLKVNLSVK